MYSRILLLLFLPFLEAFPLNYATDPFYGSNPKMIEMDFEQPSRFYSTLNGNEPSTYGIADMPSEGMASQNRKYFIRSPRHDRHFATILHQQNQATIHSPFQAAMVASDHQMRSQLRNSLQTSDDDVYEVESAPVMRSTPYHPPAAVYGTRGMYGSRQETEVPISLSFESQIEHDSAPRYYKPQSAYYQSFGQGAEALSMAPSEVNGSSSASRGGRGGFGSRRSGGRGSFGNRRNGGRGRGQQSQQMSQMMPQQSMSQQSMRPQMPPLGPPPTDMGGMGGQQGQSGQQSRSIPSRTQVTHSSRPQRGFNLGQHGNQSQQSQMSQTQRSMPGSRSASMSRGQRVRAPKMDSSWLDMGAYSSGKGAFGWYSDVPVGGATV